mmetsp:Transcript_26657/g.78754  ORF Transcript_26657/g.78754 Transcript_26657/m.78754 type:complete len:237 (+) Transcript_26657:659-1369(+)
MPLVWLGRVDCQSLEPSQPIDCLPVTKYQERRERPYLELRSEERGLHGVHPQEFALRVKRRHEFQVVVHNLAPLKVVRIKMHGDPLGGAGAFGEELVLPDGPELAVPPGHVLGLLFLRGAHLGDASGPYRFDLRVFVEQVIVLVVRVVVGIVPAAEILPPHLLPEPLHLPGLVLLPPLLLGGRRPRRPLPIHLGAVGLAVGRAGGGAVRVVQFVRAALVLLLQLPHRLRHAVVHVL